MKKRLKIFRRFEHDELRKLGIPDGIATDAFLREVADNTNKLISSRSHVPNLQASHYAEGEESLGWVEQLMVEGDSLLADVTFTRKGEDKIRSRELRFLSASFRKDASLTGDKGSPVLPGKFLSHIALLGSTPPRVKNLTDLSQIEFSEESASGQPTRIRISVDRSKGEVCFFSEMPSTVDEKFSSADFAQMATSAAVAQRIYAVAGERAQASGRTAREEVARMQAEAKYTEATFAEPEAKFSVADFDAVSNSPLQQRIWRQASILAARSGRAVREEVKEMRDRARTREGASF